ncbi:MAG: NmrA family NAD(P)-binding protein, partial [Anaerolineales bacterium]|nr:NmrA family NAD(P)-binding protein [Anaerolineales bacterium]
GADEVIVGDLLSPRDVSRAAQGTRAVYHICPNMSSNEVEIGRIAIQAAVGAGLDRFVYHSVLRPQVEKMPHHWNKRQVEEQLFESPLNYTVLQPAAYMQNTLGSWDMILQEGIFEVPYSVKSVSSLVDLHDIAQAACKVLTEDGYSWAVFELCGPEPYSQEKLAHILAEELQRPVRARQVSIEGWKRRIAPARLSSYAVDALVAMFEYYDAHGFPGNSVTLQALLGRQPTDFRAFVRRTIQN